MGSGVLALPTSQSHPPCRPSNRRISSSPEEIRTSQRGSRHSSSLQWVSVPSHHCGSPVQMATSNPTRGHDSRVSRRCLCPWLGVNFWGSSNHHDGQGGAVWHCNMVTADGNMGHHKHHYYSISPGGEWYGGTLPSTPQGSSLGLGRTGWSSVVLEASSRPAGNQDHPQAGHRCHSSGHGLRRECGSARLSALLNSLVGSRASRTGKCSPRQSSHGSRAPPANAAVDSQGSKDPNTHRSQDCITRLHSTWRRHRHPLHTLHWSISSSGEAPHLLQSVHPRKRYRVCGSRSTEACFRGASR